MRQGGGKQKGAQFEREVCRRLSLWVSNNTTEDCYWRSAMSGGRSTVAARKGKRLAAQAGDISCINKIGEWLTNLFFIECKNYRDLEIEKAIYGRGVFVEFWAEAEAQSIQYGKLPMLIAKQNQYPSIVGVSRQGAHRLELNGGCRLIIPTVGMYIYLFEDLLKLKPNVADNG